MLKSPYHKCTGLNLILRNHIMLDKETCICNLLGIGDGQVLRNLLSNKPAWFRIGWETVTNKAEDDDLYLMSSDFHSSIVEHNVFIYANMHKHVCTWLHKCVCTQTHTLTQTYSIINKSYLIDLCRNDPPILTNFYV